MVVITTPEGGTRKMVTGSQKEVEHFINKNANQEDTVDIWSRDLDNAFYTQW